MIEKEKVEVWSPGLGYHKTLEEVSYGQYTDGDYIYEESSERRHDGARVFHKIYKGRVEGVVYEKL